MIQTDKRASKSHDVHEKHIIDFLQERERCFFPLINTDRKKFVKYQKDGSQIFCLLMRNKVFTK